MKQPELGKKIVALRKANGLTQEELVEKCNLNIRTLQRIESGEVTPRSYTIKIIFSALDFDINNSSEMTQSKFSKAGLNFIQWLEQFYRYFTDLFNLKTNKMKKITILSVTLSAIFIGIFSIYSEGNSQKAEKAIKAIRFSEDHFNKWLNTGQIDSVLSLYRNDACVIPFSCGKKELYNGLKPLIDKGYKVIEYVSSEISVGDSIAVEKYSLKYQYLGMEVKQKGMKEWRLSNGKWLIVNHMMMDYK